jgi:hypothetical protein
MRKEDGPDQRVETEFLNKIETEARPLIHKLAAGHRLTEDEQLHIAFFTSLQCTRLPSFAKNVKTVTEHSFNTFVQMQFATPERTRQFFEDFQPDTGEEAGHEAEAHVESIRDGSVGFEATERNFLDHMFHSAVGLADWFMSQGEWIVLRAPDDAGFITCDHPFCPVPPQGWPHEFIGPGLPGVMNFYPLTRGSCLMIRQGQPQVKMVRINKRAVRTINMNLAANSDRFIVGRDEDQLRVIVSRSQTQEADTNERFKIEAAGDIDGMLETATVLVRRYFY